tara:strand:- start:299 stop:547 length:249 start_codon:yes stop_codon:yes gene_type:complete
MDESLIMEIWDTFKEYISDKNKETAAHQYIDFLLGKEIEISELESYTGYDTHLDIAIRAVVAEAKEWDDPEPEYFEEDDEDY